MSTRPMPWLVCVVLMLTGRAGAADVTGCNHTVLKGETGTLQQDLVCSGPGAAVRLESGATLELNGHTITLEISTSTAVECLARCTVLGPGTLTTAGDGPFGGGVVSQGKGRITVDQVTIDGFVIGVHAPLARLQLTAVTIQNGQSGLDAKRIDVDGVTIAALPLPNFNCIASSSGRIRGVDLTLTGCANGIEVRKAVDLTGLTWSGGSTGVVTTSRVKLVDSSVTGAALYDVASRGLPRLTNTTCDRSMRLDADGPSGVPWGVCVND